MHHFWCKKVFWTVHIGWVSGVDLMCGHRATYDQFRTATLTQLEVTVSRLKSVSNFFQYINLVCVTYFWDIIAMVSQHCFKRLNGCNQKERLMTELHLISRLPWVGPTCLVKSDTIWVRSSDTSIRLQSQRFLWEISVNLENTADWTWMHF